MSNSVKQYRPGMPPGEILGVIESCGRDPRRLGTLGVQLAFQESNQRVTDAVHALNLVVTYGDKKTREEMEWALHRSVFAANCALADVQSEGAVLRRDPYLVTPAASSIAERRGKEALAYLFRELTAQVISGLRPADADVPTAP